MNLDLPSQRTSAYAIDLSAAAYEKAHAPVFHAWLRLPMAERAEALKDRYVFYSYCHGVAPHVADIMKHDFPTAAEFVAAVIDEVSRLAVGGAAAFAEEWFSGLETLVDTLSRLNFHPEARQLVELGFRTGVRKFPRLAQSLAVHAAFLDTLAGRRDTALQTALSLAQRPYLLPNRRELPHLCFRLMHILAGANRLREYRLVLWTGAALPETPPGLRDAFAEQIGKTYRGFLRALISREVAWKFLLPLALAALAGAASRVSLFRALRIDSVLRGIHLLLVLLLSRFGYRRNELFRQINRDTAEENNVTSRITVSLDPLRSKLSVRKSRKILVTRAMGGIGDILMMTPGLHALTLNNPRAEVHFAAPKSFHVILQGLPKVHLIDIDSEPIQLARYSRWINLTDCPAGRVEARQYPNVRANRVEIFAKAMGVSKRKLQSTAGFLPIYRVSSDESAWAKEQLDKLNPKGLPVIGVQPFAADSYRNWPHMEALVEELSHRHLVLVFHHEPLSGFNYSNTLKILEPLRKSIALASLCEKLVVLDSSFLHFSAALGVPTFAIFGAISGKVRTRRYPNVHLFAPSKEEFPCYPCWRHEHKPCHLTNGRESICLRSITARNVSDAITTDAKSEQRKTTSNFSPIRWLRYGRE